jgi:hypothetical protein
VRIDWIGTERDLSNRSTQVKRAIPDSRISSSHDQPPPFTPRPAKVVGDAVSTIRMGNWVSVSMVGIKDHPDFGNKHTAGAGELKYRVECP